MDKVVSKPGEGRLNRKPTAPELGNSPTSKKEGEGDYSMTENGRKAKLPPLKNLKDSSNKETMNGPEIDIEEQKAMEKNYNIESVNPAEISRQILLECNYIKPHNPVIPALRSGDGHLMSLPDKSLRQIYQEVYHKKINSSMM